MKKFTKKELITFQEKELKRRGIKVVWVKQLVSNKEWRGFYSFAKTYCNLGEEGVGRAKVIKMGFCVAVDCPINCELLNDEELRMVDEFRQAVNLFPTPLEKIKTIDSKPIIKTEKEIEKELEKEKDKKEFWDIVGTQDEV